MIFSVSLYAKIAHLQEKNKSTHAAAPQAVYVSTSTPEVPLGSQKSGACMFSFVEFRTEEILLSLHQLLATCRVVTIEKHFSFIPDYLWIFPGVDRHWGIPGDKPAVMNLK